MRGIRMTTKLHRLVRGQLHALLELLPNLHQGLFSSTVSTFALAHRSRPQADAEKGFPDIDDHAHDFIVAILLQGLANRGQLSI